MSSRRATEPDVSRRCRSCPALAVASFLLVSISARAARADEVSDACIAAHVEGQELAQANKLVAARERFASCALETCPSVIRRECAELSTVVERKIPTLVVSATGADSRALDEARVELDGRLVQTRLDGRALSVDPGRHVVRVSAENSSRELTIDVALGEKERRVEARFAEPALGAQGNAPFDANDGDLSGALPYVAFGVGAVALGSFGYFALHGKSIESDLDECKPNCAQSDYDRMQTSYLLADISLGVSVVSLGIGSYLFLTRERAEKTPVTAVHAVIASDRVSLSAQGRF